MQRVALPTRTELAYERAGAGGVPLLLVHGWPETSRIWSKVIGPLAAAGFDVIAPDLRGFGESGYPADDCYDIGACSDDLAALLDALDLWGCVACGGDYGGPLLYDLGLSRPDLIDRQLIFNSPLPMLREAFAAAGLRPPESARDRPETDYFVEQGVRADDLLARLPTRESRRDYVAQFYTTRHWARPGSIAAEDVDFLVEPFLDARRLRASFAISEHALGQRPKSRRPIFDRPSPVPTIVLHGPEDRVIAANFPDLAAVAFTECTGPFVVPGAGHFLPWERPVLLTRTLALLR